MIIVLICVVGVFLIILLYNYNKFTYTTDLIQPRPSPYQNINNTMIPFCTSNDCGNMLVISGGALKGLSVIFYLKHKYAKQAANAISDGNDFLNDYKFFSGTSTGAILTAGLGARSHVCSRLRKNDTILENMATFFETTPDKLLAENTSNSRFILLYLQFLYIQESKTKLFTKSVGWTFQTLGGLVGPKYPSPSNFVFEIFGHFRMCDLHENGVFIFAQKMDTLQTIIFNNVTQTGLQVSKPYYFAECILMAISTPVFFPSHQGFIDAGFLSNDPVFETLSYLLHHNKLNAVDNVEVITLTQQKGGSITVGDNGGLLQWITQVPFLAINTSMLMAKQNTQQFFQQFFSNIKSITFYDPIQTLISTYTSFNVNIITDIIHHFKQSNAFWK